MFRLATLYLYFFGGTHREIRYPIDFLRLKTNALLVKTISALVIAISPSVMP